jgi:hypothetical protein
MIKEQGAVPVYSRIGICKECGADVYAPQGALAEGEFKRLSGCGCAGGPKGEAAGRLSAPPAPGKGNSAHEKKAA